MGTIGDEKMILKPIKKHKRYYMKSYEDGVLLYVYEVDIKRTKTTAEAYINVKNIIEFNIGKTAKAYKRTRKGFEEMEDIFSVLPINSATIKDGINILYEDATGPIDFLLKNKEFAKKTGSIEFLNSVDLGMTLSTAFLIYIYSLSEYTSIELIEKMGYYKLLTELFSKLRNQPNKEQIGNVVKDANRLIKYSTKGSTALAIPKFAADYLNNINARLHDYEQYITLFEYQDINKNQFFEIIEDPLFTEYDVNKDCLFELLKYGYEIKPLLKYIRKQFQKNDNISNVLIEALDYNHMAKLMGVTVEPYPENIRKAHDDLANVYEIKKHEINEMVISNIANKCEDLIPEDDVYEIIVPSSIKEFVEEGKAQHNCVASYVNDVAAEKCIIFFIRKKEDPTESYITAEYRSYGLAQIRYKYNRYVYNSTELKLAEKFCKIITANKKYIFSSAK